MFARRQPEVSQRDNFEAVPMKAAEEMLDLFVAPFWFGCEADDPVNAQAFNRHTSPFGAPLQAVLGSDAAHWDVVDMASVLGEAWDLVETGAIDADDFRDFVYTNPVRLHAGMNPEFFSGTRVEAAAAEIDATARRPVSSRSHA